MAHSAISLALRTRLAIVLSTLRLARWQLRQTRRLLLGAGLGIVAAVTIVCAVPFFTNVTTTAGLRSALSADPAGNTVTVNVTTPDPGKDNIDQISLQIDTTLQAGLGRYLSADKQFSALLPHLGIHMVSRDGQSHALGNATMGVVGYDAQQLASHVHVLTGRLPQASSARIEIAVTQAIADSLGVTVGSTIMLFGATESNMQGDLPNIPVSIVGIIAPPQDDAFFHHLSFDPQRLDFPPSALFYQVITTNDNLLDYLQASPVLGPYLTDQTQFYWYYSLIPLRFTATTLNSVLGQINALQNDLPHILLGLDTPARGSVSSDAFVTLVDYQTRINTVQVPLTFLLALMIVFVLFFVSVMAEIIVERQSDAIAVMRSRGTSRWQIFGALALQSLGVGALALAVGPWLALAAVIVIARFALPVGSQSALDVLTTAPLHMAYPVPWYVIAVLVAVMGAMILAMNRAASVHVLAMRREAVRPTTQPVWQRLNLDVLLAFIALTGALLYSLVLQQVSPTLQYQFGFLGLVAPTFLLLAGTLLFFRLYPLLLRASAWLAGRAKGAMPVLAFGQMSRTPRQAMRPTFLLAFSTALLVFTLLFIASEAQHLRDVAAFSVGADFSGALPSSFDGDQSLAHLTQPYSQILGVKAAAAGYITDVPESNGIDNQQLLAVDADHYAQAADWDVHNSQESLASLMALLVGHRDDATRGSVPAILNGPLWDALHLVPGERFALLVPGDDTGSLSFIALTRVDHIESIYDSPQFSSGGILVDYQSYAAVFTKVTGTPPASPNHIWLRTADDAASVAHVRQALTTGNLKLVGLLDRHALTQSLLADPLQIDLSGVLTIGSISALLLALVGALTASWQSARGRLTQFVVLRALGTSPRQIASVLLWEQGMVYGVALVMGTVLGGALTQLLLPFLVFADARTTNSSDLIGAANVPIIQVVVPLVPLSLALGSLVALSVGAVALMTFVVARPSLSATLRLNED